MDFREGGSWLYAMVGPEGEEHWALAQYSDIKPQTAFTGVDAFTDSQGKIAENMPQSKWNVRFSDNGDDTLVDFHISYDDLAQLQATIDMGFKDGLRIAMEGLDELLPSLQKEAK